MEADKTNGRKPFPRRLSTWLYQAMCWCVVKPTPSGHLPQQNAEPERQAAVIATVEHAVPNDEGDEVTADDVTTHQSAPPVFRPKAKGNTSVNKCLLLSPHNHNVILLSLTLQGPSTIFAAINSCEDWQLPNDYPSISLVDEVMDAIQAPLRIMDRFWSDFHTKTIVPGSFPLLKLYIADSVVSI